MTTGSVAPLPWRLRRRVSLAQHARGRYDVGFQKEGTPAFQNLSPLTCPLA
jgi:hypothetical protein